MRCVRVWFEKTGSAKYISHLDLMRCITRAIKRAKIPVWYTEGFNPHPYITFPRPLSLGLESLCECVDMRLDGEMANEEVCNRLAQVMPSGITIKSVKEPFMEQTEIEFSEYHIQFAFSKDAQDFADSMKELLNSQELIVEKISKSGRHKKLKQINILEHMKEYTISIDANKVLLRVILPAGNTVSINPSLLSEALQNAVAAEEDLVINIVRTRLLTKNFQDFE